MNEQGADEAHIPDTVLSGALDVWRDNAEQHYIPITGSSMLPLIRDGDRVLVAHDWSGVRRGDVVVFRQAGELVAHRVLRVVDADVGPVFLTKGDNVFRTDLPVDAGEVVGRVLAVKRGRRELRIDASLWRVVGWFIAIIAVTGSRSYAWGRSVKRRLLGDRHLPGVSTLRRGVSAFSSLILSAIQSVLGRWRE